MAVRYLSERIDECDNLKASIATQDRQILIDGTIEIYSSAHHAVKTIVGSVPVQVKGKRVDNVYEPLLSYDLKVDEIKGFDALGGCLFFVVAIQKKNTSKRKAYFAPLFHAEVEKYLAETKAGQGTKSIPLRPLGNSPESLERVINFCAEAKQQSPIELPFEAFGELQSLTVTPLDPIDPSKPTWIGRRGTPAIIYVKLENGIEAPANVAIQLIPQEYTLQPIGQPVSCGGVVFNDSRARRIDDTTFEIRVSPGITITATTDSRKGKIDIRSRRTVFDNWKDLSFLSNWSEFTYIKIGEYQWGMKLDQHSESDALKKEYELYERITELFARLGIDGRNVDPSCLDKENLEKLQNLYNYFHGSSRVNVDSTIPMRQELGVGNKSIHLLYCPNQSNERWTLWGWTQKELPPIAAPLGEDGQPLVCTPYNLLSSEDLTRTLNLNFDYLISSFIERVPQVNQISLGNEVLLKLLTASDECPPRRREFLAAALELAEWLCGLPNAELFNKLNRWQVLKRLGQLTDPERAEIQRAELHIERRTKEQRLNEAACKILLDKHDEAKLLLESIPEDEQANIRNQPIEWFLKHPETEYEIPPTPAEDEWAKIEEEIFQESLGDGWVTVS